MPPVTLSPTADLGEAELGVLGGDHQVAGQRELAAGAERVAVDSGEHRAGEAADQPGDLLDGLEPLPGLHRGLDRPRAP